MCLNIITPNALLSLKLFMNVFYHFGKESSCTCGWVKDLYFVYLLVYGFYIILVAFVG